MRSIIITNPYKISQIFPQLIWKQSPNSPFWQANTINSTGSIEEPRVGRSRPGILRRSTRRRSINVETLTSHQGKYLFKVCFYVVYTSYNTEAFVHYESHFLKALGTPPRGPWQTQTRIMIYTVKGEIVKKQHIVNLSAVGAATEKTTNLIIFISKAWIVYHDTMYGSTVRYQNAKSGAITQAEQISCEYKSVNIKCISQFHRHFSDYILSSYPFPPPGVESQIQIGPHHVAGKPRHKMQVESRLKW